MLQIILDDTLTWMSQSEGACHHHLAFLVVGGIVEVLGNLHAAG